LDRDAKDLHLLQGRVQKTKGVEEKPPAADANIQRCSINPEEVVELPQIKEKRLKQFFTCIGRVAIEIRKTCNHVRESQFCQLFNHAEAPFCTKVHGL